MREIFCSRYGSKEFLLHKQKITKGIVSNWKYIRKTNILPTIKIWQTTSKSYGKKLQGDLPQKIVLHEHFIKFWKVYVVYGRLFILNLWFFTWIIVLISCRLLFKNPRGVSFTEVFFFLRVSLKLFYISSLSILVLVIENLRKTFQCHMHGLWNVIWFFILLMILKLQVF